MRRMVVGLIVLVAVSLGGGAYAFGSGGGSIAIWSAAPGASSAGQPPDPAPTVPATPTTPTTPTAPARPSTTPSGPASSPPSSKSPGSSASSGRSTPAKPVGCAQGDRQRDAEAALAAIGEYGPVTVDGVQSAADCAAIKRFQQRFGISPANGRAGATTAGVARRIAASRTPEVRGRCRAGAGLTACIDLTLQTVWVVRGGSVVWGPTIVRTGFRGYATPSGTYKINYRNPKEWSNPYKVWLPYWQHFTRGMGFHETTTYIHNASIGSHGCVNLLRSDARALWSLIGYGTTVHTFGRRAGT